MKKISQLIGKREGVPPFDLVALRDATRHDIDRPTEPDTNTDDFMPAKQLAPQFFDSTNDADRTSGDVNLGADQLVESAGLAVANTELELGSADFDAEDGHEGGWRPEAGAIRVEVYCPR